MKSERYLVEAGTISFVAFKSVVIFVGSQFLHEAITGCFGEDGSSGDAKAALVAFDQGGLRGVNLRKK